MAGNRFDAVDILGYVDSIAAGKRQPFDTA